MNVAQYTDYTMSRPDRVSHTIMTITPEIAQAYLDTGAPNRRISKASVRTYASDMRNGRWEYNGQDIILDRDGALIDGQHRLLAVIESGQNILMGVKRGLDRSVFETIDSGRARNAADVIGLMSTGHQKLSAGIARYALLMDKFGNPRAGWCTRRDITDYFLEWPQIAGISQHVVAGTKSVVPATPVATVWFMATRHGVYSHDEMAAFFTPVQTGADLSPGDPRLALRNWAVNQRLRGGGRLDTDRTLCAIIRAWQLYVDGKSISNIAVPIGGFANNYIPGQDPL